MRKTLMIFMIAVAGSGCVSSSARIRHDIERDLAARCEQDRRDMMEALAFRDNEIKNLKRENARLENELAEIRQKLLKK